MELSQIRNIGPKTLDKLNANGIYTPMDLLLFFPKKYTIYQVDNTHAWSGEMLCFKCQIASRPVLIKARGNSKAFVFYVLVNQKKCKCIIFTSDYLRYKLQQGLWIIAYGRYKEKENEFVLSNLFFEEFNYRIECEYGIKDIHNKLLQKAVNACMNECLFPSETLPLELIEKYRLLSKKDLIIKAHFPQTSQDCIQVRRRIRYEDFFWYTASLEALKITRGFERKNPKIFSEDRLIQKMKQLPYELTQDQEHAIFDIWKDLESAEPMNRLVEGDVGCGKSIVAYMAAMAVVEAGYQVAIMAPTELLANQHYENLKKWHEYDVALLTSSTKEKDKEDILFRLLHHRIQILVGTHALLQGNVIFSSLGLVIIDEQHRFGVEQRKSLLDKLKGVDALYLTATPIPRTLGLTAFGDLKLSVIQQMPKDRKPVITKIIPNEGIEVLSRLLQKHLELKEQIYIVVPLIEESDSMEFMDIQYAYNLFQKLLPNASMAMLHGKMKSKEKNQVMADFLNHTLDVLISTTVIEVGVDVRNATIMVILDADRYGLAQIHQLRGRVGRGDIQSYCYLVSKKEDTPRLMILENTNSGFELAEEDLKLRGPGDFLGEDQSGFHQLGFDYTSKDVAIWKCALEDSKVYVAKYYNQEFSNEKMERIIELASRKKSKIN